MRRAMAATLLVFVMCSWSMAQSNTAPQTGGMPNFNFDTPRALSGDWWRDPQVADALHLTDAQKKQLEQASLNMKLSLIGAAANGATALIKAESALNGDTLDEMTYDQQVNATADAAAKLIKDVGTTMLSMRKILSPEQWRKLNSMRDTPSQATRPQARRWEQQGNQRP